MVTRDASRVHSKLDALLAAAAHGYTLLALLALATALAVMIARYSRLADAQERLLDSSTARAARFDRMLGTGDFIPRVPVVGTHSSGADAIDAIAARSRLIYFFSPDCPGCRTLAPILMRASGRAGLAWVSTAGRDRTEAYVDSLRLPGVVWYRRSPADGTFRLLGVPALVRVERTEQGPRVYSVAIGVSAVAFMLSLERQLEPATLLLLDSLGRSAR